MKKGKEIGTYEFKAVAYRVLPHGRVEVNVEGKASHRHSDLSTGVPTLFLAFERESEA